MNNYLVGLLVLQRLDCFVISTNISFFSKAILFSLTVVSAVSKIMGEKEERFQEIILKMLIRNKRKCQTL